MANASTEPRCRKDPYECREKKQAQFQTSKILNVVVKNKGVIHSLLFYFLLRDETSIRLCFRENDAIIFVRLSLFYTRFLKKLK